MPWSKIGNIKGPGSLIDLGTVTIGQTATIAIASGVRTVTVTVNGLLAGDRVLLAPLTVFPGGYLVGQPVARAANTLDVQVFAPALVIGTAYSFQAKVTAVRP